MKELLYIISSTLLLTSCDSDTVNKPDQPEVSNKVEVPKTQKSFETCFSNVDTTQSVNTIGCSGGFFKVIDNKYLIAITPSYRSPIDDCLEEYIDSTNHKTTTELWVFEDGDASLTNICTDVIIMNMPQPKKVIKDGIGKIQIGFSDPTDYYGNMMLKATIIIEELTFMDKETGEEIRIENELLWKVLDLGTAG